MSKAFVRVSKKSLNDGIDYLEGCGWHIKEDNAEDMNSIRKELSRFLQIAITDIELKP
jgi:hypothetical protein